MVQDELQDGLLRPKILDVMWKKTVLQQWIEINLYMSFSGTDESVLLRFAKVSERMWVALFLGSFACVFPTREGSVGSFWKVSWLRKVPSPLRCETFVFKLLCFRTFP